MSEFRDVRHTGFVAIANARSARRRVKVITIMKSTQT